MSNSIEGKIVVITGASSGMGEAAARHLEPLLPLRIILPGLGKVARTLTEPVCVLIKPLTVIKYWPPLLFLIFISTLLTAPGKWLTLISKFSCSPSGLVAFR